MNSTFSLHRNRSGQAPLVIILMGASFTVASWVLISTYTSVESNLNIRSQDERLQIEQTLMGAVDCSRTMLQFGLTSSSTATKCHTQPGIQNTGVYVPLLNADGDLVTTTWDATNLYGDIGNWSFRASCYTSGTAACLMVHAARPWANGEFKKQALLKGREESWKKLPNTPWPNCCFSPPACTSFTISPSPIAVGNSATFTLVTSAATSATITTSDGQWTDVAYPLTPSTKSFTPGTKGTFTATVTIVGPGGLSTCNTSYRVVDPPQCTLAANPTAITLGQSSNILITWTNSGDPDAVPIQAQLVEMRFPSPTSGETSQAISIPMPLPTTGSPTQSVTVNPPMGATDARANGFRTKYLAQISSTAGSSTCMASEIAVCPLATPLGFYQLRMPDNELCTTCDRADSLVQPNPAYRTMTHGFTVAPTNSLPDLSPIQQNFSAGKVDYWTGRTNLGGADYTSPATVFYAYAQNSFAPGLIEVRQFSRTTANPNATTDDVFLFPNDNSQPALEADYLANGYTKSATAEFYACPWTGNYVPN